MLTDDDWAEIWRRYVSLYAGADSYSCVNGTTRRRIAKCVDAKLRERGSLLEEVMNATVAWSEVPEDDQAAGLGALFRLSDAVTRYHGESVLEFADVDAKLRGKAEADQADAETARGDMYRCVWCEQLTHLPERSGSQFR